MWYQLTFGETEDRDQPAGQSVMLTLQYNVILTLKYKCWTSISGGQHSLAIFNADCHTLTPGK